MKIGDAARHLGTTASTIRFYEKQGLIAPPPRISGKREIGDSTLVTLRFIQLCQSAGFTINEIRELLENYTNDTSNVNLWLPAVEKKRIEVQKQINELNEVDTVLAELTACRCESIEQCVGFAIKDPRWTKRNQQ